MMTDSALVLDNVSKSYAIYSKQLVDRFKEKFVLPRKRRHVLFKAVKPLSLDIKKGETVGILGHNGAGKSTLLKLIAGVKQPTSGSIEVKGQLVALLELGAGFNPEFTGLENIRFYCSLIGMTHERTEAIIPAVLDFAEIGAFINQPLKVYSSGMRARLAFSVSTAIEPDILILDEILSVGDILFQRKCFAKMEEFFKSGRTIIFVSHNMDIVRNLCKRALLFHKGELILDGPSHIVAPRYHKLMFATLEQQEQMVKKIRKLNRSPELKDKMATQPDFQKIQVEGQSKTENQSLDQDQLDYFAEGFQSKSRKEVRAKNIEISNYSLERWAGGEVNHLRQGNKYRLVFNVHFHESLRLVNFGAWFYSSKSKPISGFTLPSESNSIDQVNSGSRYKISAGFTCHFNRGLYGIKLIVRGEDNHLVVPISTTNDALVFQVLDQSGEGSHGFVKILNEWSLEEY